MVIFEILGDRYYCFMFSLSSVSPNHSLSDDNIGAMGISRSTTSSPVPQSMQSTAWITCRRMIYIKSNPPSGHWPVPESFWPDPSMQALVCMFYELFYCSPFIEDFNKHFYAFLASGIWQLSKLRDGAGSW